MGNVTSGLTGTTENSSSTNKKQTEISISDEEQQTLLIDQMIDISLELLKKYNQEFLREEFCYDIAFVMEQQLNGMNIKVLRDVERKMNEEGKELTPELRMILQHVPKNDEKFFIEGFEKQLNDLFWNQSLVYDPEVLKKEGIEEDEGVDLSGMNFFKEKNKFRYVDLSKVNDLLRDRQFQKKKVNNAMETQNLQNNQQNLQNQNSENEDEVNVEMENEEVKMSGGANSNVNQFKQQLKNNLKGKNQKQNKPQNKEAQRVELSGNNFTNNNLAKLRESFKQTLKNPKLSSKNKANSIQELVIEDLNQRIQKKQKTINNEEVIHAKMSNSNAKKNKLRVRNLVTMVRNEVTNNMKKTMNNVSQQQQSSNKNATREELKNEVNKLIQQEMSKMNQNITKNTKVNQSQKPQNNQLQKPQNNQPQKPQNNQPQKPQNNQTQKPKEEKVTENKKNNKTNNKMVNDKGMVRFTTSKDYQKPTQFCVSGVDKCSLSKKDLCKVITENIIVRCNIIAAILSVLPNKKSKNGHYFGGYLYNKFLNLGKCQVCVPKNYNDLKKFSPLQMVKHVVQFADFMDFKSCKDNNGYYLQLSKDQIKALYDNVPKNETQIGDKTNFNKFYIECAENLKESYFSNLKLLSDILMELKNNPFINNDTLNKIGLKTKEIIDSMYHLIQYYYIFGIVSLLNANLTKVDEQEITLQKSFAKVLKKKSKSTSVME